MTNYESLRTLPPFALAVLLGRKAATYERCQMCDFAGADGEAPPGCRMPRDCVCGIYAWLARDADADPRARQLMAVLRSTARIRADADALPDHGKEAGA